MSEAASIWFFLSILAICVTWFKIAALPQRQEPSTPAREMKFVYNGQPVNGSLELIIDGKSSHFKLIDGKIA